MCGFLAPKAPPVAAIPEAPQSTAAQESDPAVQQSRDEARKRRQAAAGANDTLVTGGQGLTTPAATGLKTATGQ
jgi:hypothetical protein